MEEIRTANESFTLLATKHSVRNEMITTLFSEGSLIHRNAACRRET